MSIASAEPSLARILLMPLPPLPAAAGARPSSPSSPAGTSTAAEVTAPSCNAWPWPDPAQHPVPGAHRDVLLFAGAELEFFLQRRTPHLRPGTAPRHAVSLFPDKARRLGAPCLAPSHPLEHRGVRTEKWKWEAWGMLVGQLAPAPTLRWAWGMWTLGAGC